MEKLRKIYDIVYGHYLDYRYKVPPASALSFAYYMILSIIPICTLLAFFTPFFPLDIKTAQEILSYYLRPDVTKMVIQLIKPRSLSITTVTTLIASLFVVSRGFYQEFPFCKKKSAAICPVNLYSLVMLGITEKRDLKS